MSVYRDRSTVVSLVNSIVCQWKEVSPRRPTETLRGISAASLNCQLVTPPLRTEIMNIHMSNNALYIPRQQLLKLAGAGSWYYPTPIHKYTVARGSGPGRSCQCQCQCCHVLESGVHLGKWAGFGCCGGGVDYQMLGRVHGNWEDVCSGVVCREVARMGVYFAGKCGDGRAGGGTVEAVLRLVAIDLERSIGGQEIVIVFEET